MNLSATGLSAQVLGTTRVTVDASASVNTWYLIECHLKLGVADGLIQVRLDGVASDVWTGNTQGTGTKIAQVRPYRAGNGYTYFDDIVINDTSGPHNNYWPGDTRLIPLRPNGAGDSSQWSDQAKSQAANYAAVDEASSDSDTTYVKTDAPDQVDLYNITDYTLAEGDVVRGVCVMDVSRTVSAEGDLLATGIKVGATEVWDAPHGVNTSYRSYVGDYHPVAPDGSVWNAEKLNALQVGVKSVAGS
ncbi:hypothetical protein [Aggregatilinea lenta]|uniref:hypothetical protein n=1 Tax=Aggregatilinea lenta TaxID=913108 RepID=UPI0013C2B557|nr:hypothetical protein [Aggregatilinea lenta]